MNINKQWICKRKGIILNYKLETFIVSRNLIKNIEKLKITIPCQTDSSNDEIKRYKLSILKPYIREKIVPRCLRHKCRNGCYKDQYFREAQEIKTKNKNNRTKYMCSMKSRHEQLLYPKSKYDDISSESLSSYEDIETLISSTRTRMKELNEHWEFRPRAFSTNTNTNEIRGSINSLDTLFLGNNDHEDPIKCKPIISAFHSSRIKEETENIEAKKKKYFSSYKSPNICIVPSESICYPPSPKRPKLEMPARDNSPQNVDLSFLDDFDVDEIVNCLNDCDDNTQNTAKLKNMENNDDTFEKGCPESSFEIEDNNEINEFKYRNIEIDSLTESRDNGEIEIGVEKTHKNMNTNITFNEKEVKGCSTNCYDNKHADVNKDEDDPEIFEPSEMTNLPNDETYSQPNNVNSIEIITKHLENKTENNNTQELLKEKRIEKCLLQTDQDLASINKAFKPINGEGKTEHKIESNTIMKNVDNITHCEETYLQYSGDAELQNKHHSTPIMKVEKTIDKFNTNETIENKELHIPVISKSLESENLKNIHSSQNINRNENRVKSQKVTDKKLEVLCENVNKPESDELTFNNLEKLMLQCLDKKYSMFSLIHSGKFSKIFKCNDSGGKHYAVKMLKKKGNGYRKEGMWSRIQGDIPKENLLCVYLIAGFSLNSNWCYLTDFYPKNLNDLLKESKKNLHIDTIQELAGQLVGAVTTLRNKNIVHSDINPSHILLDCTNSKLRLCGFDGAYYIEAANLFPYKGTKCYRAPEVILGYSAGFSLDVWSTALVLHEMATGIKIFGGCRGNHVLYKQMCILGDIPPQMLLRSCYRNKYIFGYCLQNDRCSRHQQDYMVKGKNKIACTIQGAYYSHWTEGKNQKQISKDLQKIRQFTRLIEQMLVIYPEHRLPIEFAYSNPFIYKAFNN